MAIRLKCAALSAVLILSAPVVLAAAAAPFVWEPPAGNTILDPETYAVVEAAQRHWLK